MKIEAEGSRSLGFKTKLLPHARAKGNIQHGTMQGKLKGVTPATTPSGWRKIQLSMPVLALSLKSPLSNCGTPQANSMMSRRKARHPKPKARKHAQPSLKSHAACNVRGTIPLA
jgi:hypothetical protein